MYKCTGRYIPEKVLIMLDITLMEGVELRVPRMGIVGGSRSSVGHVRVRLTTRYA